MSINADTNADTNLAVVAEMYVPNIDNAGNYTDHIPAVNTGIRCACGARKDKVYTRPQFTGTLTRCAIRMDRFAKHESHQLLYGSLSQIL
jgi:hypothetical protein